MRAILCEVLFEFESQNVSSFTHNNNNNNNNNKNNMADKFTVGTSNTLEKVWNIDVEREYRKLSYLFQNPERNNGIIKESLRQLKMFIHQQSTDNHVSLLFRREFKRIWNRLGGDKSPPGTFTERDETKRWSIRHGGVDTNSTLDQNGPISMWK